MEYEITPPKNIYIDFKELIRFKELFYIFTWRDIKIKYKQTYLGFIWVLIQPLLMMGIFTIFFGVALGINGGDMPYPIFIFSGLLFWNFFANGLATIGNSMITNSAIIKKVYFPKVIIPVSNILSSSFDTIIAFVFFIVILLYYNFFKDIEFSFLRILLFFPICLILISIATFGPGCLLGALNVKYRDFRYVIPFVIQVLFFITPVIYNGTTLFKFKFAKYLFAINPVAAPIELFRFAIDGKSFEFFTFFTSLTVSLILFFVGLLYFKKAEVDFADIS